MARDQALNRSDSGKGASPWLAQVDRAWANPSLRRQFETKHDLRPLGETAHAQEADVQTGYASIYRELFALWATASLGFEALAPAGVRTRLREAGAADRIRHVVS